ncbi:MAG: STN and carboxypeptidase regulatory-like domain-containing protein [Emticicia sp.]|uniref:STN and carboxypeptidase regulatory-like domain-containing protein n=1 Tax=Emticicia sp. TaxID=1930953 RepID=UPI003BA7E8CB
MKKLFTFFLLLSITQVFAQNRPPLERIISIKISNERLDNALKSIANAGNFSFSYNPDEFSVEKRVSVSAQNQAVREILSDIFGNTATFKNRNNYIILKKASEEPQKDFFVMGYVSDGETGLKIEKASIYEPVTLASAISNQYGYYRLKIPKELNNVNLLVRKQNYQDERILIRSKQDKTLNIKLLAIPKLPKVDTIARLISFKIDSLPNKKLDSLPVIQPVITKIEPVEAKDSIIIEIPRIDYQEYWNTAKEQLQITQRRLTDWFITTKQNIHLDNVRDTLYRPAQISFLPFIGTNHYLSGNVINNVSINIIGGYSLGVRSLEIGGLFNVVRGKVYGIQASGFANLVGQDVKGVQMAGFGSVNGRNFYGVQASGFGNLNGGSTGGIQMAGFGNASLKNFSGIQAAGFGNFVLEDTHASIQAAGFGNTTIGNTNGLQVAGFGNFTGKNLKGIQIAGVANWVDGKMSGLQISLFNYAKKAQSGHQIGLFNFAKENENSVPIGLLSFAGKGGYRRLELGADEVNWFNMTFKTGVKRFYNILTAGYNFGLANKPDFSLGYGLGTSWKLNRTFWLNFDVVSSHIQQNGNYWNLRQHSKASLGLEIHATRHIALFVSPTINFLASKDEGIDLGKLNNWKISEKQGNYFGQKAMLTSWVGIQGGIRLF